MIKYNSKIRFDNILINLKLIKANKKSMKCEKRKRPHHALIKNGT